MNIDVTDFGAVGNGYIDDTQNILNAYKKLVSSGGGTLFFPPGGYKFNLLIDNPNIMIRGSGRSAPTSQGGRGGTYFIPADFTKPCIQIGDGIKPINTITLKSFNMFGDKNAETSDGLVINGAYYINVDDFGVYDFGRDNIRIDGDKRPSFNIYFNQFLSKWAKGSAFKIVEAGSIYINNFLLSGRNSPSSYALYLDNGVLSAQNGWIQISSSLEGHVYLTGDRSKITGFNVNLDSNSSNDNIIELNYPSGAIHAYLIGQIIIDGKIKWRDGTVNDAFPNYTYMANLSWSQVSDVLTFGQSNAAGSIKYQQSNTKLYRINDNPQETVMLTGAAFRPHLTYEYPLQGIDGGAMWRNKETGQIRYRYDSRFPASDNAGVPFSTFVSVPASANSKGNPGEWSADEKYLYVCHKKDTWKRTKIESW
ncbi:glycosyl hydrolase family 28-related protein [Peribacillus sp. NPDC096379]|uniref:glycosyl hydrolase family 28-related protein n=1 Tax=Peribacillus sp. NPDC096379 TaxID=3364393 RepID=UPI0037FBD757